MMSSSLKFRAANPDIESKQFRDIAYNDLIHDPKGVVEGIYQFIGMSFEDHVTEYVRSNKEERKNITKHTYDMVKFGLTAERIDEEFKEYKEKFGYLISKK